jgi:DNA-binding SARP family transcriptional activator
MSMESVMGRLKGGKKSEEAEELSVRAFGGLIIYYQGSPITVIWESQKARLLFCYLLVTYDQWIHRDKLIEALWPGCDPGAGANNFKTTISRLRKSFCGSRIINPVLMQGEAVRINFAAISLDSSQFLHKATTGIKLLARGETNEARKYLEEAQDLYTGEFLTEEPFNHYITITRDELADLHTSVIISLERIYHQQGNTEAMDAIRILTKALVPHIA